MVRKVTYSNAVHMDVNDGGRDTNEGGVGSLLLYLDSPDIEGRVGGEFYVPELELLLETAHGWGVWLLSDELAHHTLAGQCTRGVRQCSAHYLSKNLSSAEQRPGPSTKRPKTRQ